MREKKDPFFIRAVDLYEYFFDKILVASMPSNNFLINITIEQIIKTPGKSFDSIIQLNNPNNEKSYIYGFYLNRLFNQENVSDNLGLCIYKTVDENIKSRFCEFKLFKFGNSNPKCESGFITKVFSPIQITKSIHKDDIEKLSMAFMKTLTEFKSQENE